MPALSFLTSILPKSLSAYITASPISSRLVKGTIWSFTGMMVSRAITMLFTVLTARILGTVGYGEVGIINNTVDTFTVFAGFGLGLTTTKYLAQYVASDKIKAGRIMALTELIAIITGAIIAVLLATVAPWLASHSLAAPHLAFPLRLSAITLLFATLSGVQMGALSGLEAFKSTATLNIVVGTIRAILTFTGAYLWGVNGMVYGLVVSSVIDCTLNNIVLRAVARQSNLHYIFSGCFKERSILFSFSFPSFLSNAMIVPTMWGANAILVNQPNGYVSIGIFNACFAFHNMVLMIGNVIGMPLLPVMSNIGKHHKGLASINMVITWSVGTLLIMPLMTFPEIVHLMYGKGFTGEAIKVTFILTMLRGAIMMYKQGLARALQLHDMMWWGFASNVLWAICLVGSIYFLRGQGAIGLATGYLIAYAVTTVIFFPLYIRVNMVPRDTLISKQALVVWTAMGVLAILAYAGIPFWIRLCSLCIGMWVTFISFKFMVMSSLNTKTPPSTAVEVDSSALQEPERIIQ